MQFTPLEIWKWHSVLFGIHAGSPNTKISRCMGVNLRTDSYWWKSNTLSTLCGLGWSLAIVWHYASTQLFTWPHPQHQVPRKGSATLNQEGDYWKTLHLATGLCAMPHTQAEPSFSCKKISVTTSYLTSGYLIPRITIPLIIMFVVQWSEKPAKLYVSPKMDWKQVLTNLNNETLGKACKRFLSCLEALVESNADFLE